MSIAFSQTKKETVKIPNERDFLKIVKINPQQEKPVFPNRRKLVPAKHKNRPFAKLNFRKISVLHGIYQVHVRHAFCKQL